MSKVTLIGGPFAGHVDLRREPPRIQIAGIIYERIDDPDTGDPLGAYAVAPSTRRRTRAKSRMEP